MSVLFPWIALAGVGLVALPVVLHLIMRQKPRRLEFPALQFVRQRHESNQRRLRLRHLLLLLLRGAVILLVALALSYPRVRLGARLSGALGGQEAPVAAALVFDTAPRMQYRQENQTRLEAAQELSLWLLGQLPRNSDVAVLDTRLGLGKFEIDLLAAEKRIERLQSVADSQSLPLVIEEALRRLTESELAQKEIYVFTDLAHSGWPESSADRLQRRLADMPEVRLCLIDVGAEEPANIGLGELQLSGEVFSNRGSLRIETDLSRIDPAAPQTSVQRTVEVQLIDDQGQQQKRSEEDFSLEAGQSQRVDFRVGSLGLGTHQGFVRIVGQDGLAADDTRYFTVEVQPAWRILIAAPKPAQQYARYLTQALAPTMLRQRGEAGFVCDVIELSELTQRSPYQYAAVCLLDPTPLEPAIWKKLGEYVAEGNGLAIFLGRNARVVDSFNSDAARLLLPGKLLQQGRAPEGDLHLAPMSYEHPILSPFSRLAGAVPWDQSPVFRYWMLDEMAEGVGVVIPLSNGEPALLERPLGQGRVLTMTTPISDNPNQQPWNLLPGSLQADQAWPFLILANQMASYLVGSSEQQLNYLAGQPAMLRLASGDQYDIYHVFAPDGLTFPLSVDRSQRLLIVSATDRVGNYRVRAGGITSGVDRGFSVNLAPEQTQLERISEKQLAEVLGEVDYRIARTSAEIERDISTARIGRELFPTLILLVVIVLAAEHVVANRFYRET